MAQDGQNRYRLKLIVNDRDQSSVIVRDVENYTVANPICIFQGSPNIGEMTPYRTADYFLPRVQRAFPSRVLFLRLLDDFSVENVHKES